MKSLPRILWFILVGTGLLPTLARAQSDAALAAISGYVDADRTGTNDRFRDADGDGVNDVTGKPYPHRFGYADQDHDGANDLFVDADGDGVNDRDGRAVDLDRDGVCDNVLDQDANGRNDVTGESYDDQLRGWRLGLVDEEAGKTAPVFVDEDGDGTNDSWQTSPGHGTHGEAMDLFIDEDGDGIADGRTVRGREEHGHADRNAATSRGTGKTDQGTGREKESKGQGGHRRHGAGNGH